MGTAFLLFGIFVVIIIIRYAFDSNEKATSNPASTISIEEGKRRKDELIKRFFTPKVYVDPNDSVGEDGIRTLRRSILDDNEAFHLVDDFTKENSVILKKVAGGESGYIPLHTTIGNSELILIYLSFAYAKGTYAVSLIATTDNIQISNYDTVYFLFEGGDTISYTFRNPAQIWDAPGSTINHFGISETEIKKFAELNLDKWRIDCAISNKICIGDLTKNVELYDKKEVQYTIKQMARKIIEIKNKFA